MNVRNQPMARDTGIAFVVEMQNLRLHIWGDCRHS